MSLSQQEVVELRKQLGVATQANRISDMKRIMLKLRQEMVATQESLKETKIGLTVGKLRSYADKSVSELAKDIIKKWKNDVGPIASSKSSAQNSLAPSPAGAASVSPAPSSVSAPKPNIKPDPVKAETPQPSPVSKLAPAIKDGTPRSSATDGQKFDKHGDPTRDKCMQLIYDALVFDSTSPAELVYSRTLAIEACVFRQEGNDTTPKYRTKMRSLFMNLKDKSNPSLRESVISGTLAVEQLCVMTPAEMASEERKAQDRKLMEENLFKARAAENTQSETDTFKCGRCGQRKCTYYQMQTRSADEPMTTFVTCTVCQNKWKFC